MTELQGAGPEAPPLIPAMSRRKYTLKDLPEEEITAPDLAPAKDDNRTSDLPEEEASPAPADESAAPQVEKEPEITPEDNNLSGGLVSGPVFLSVRVPIGNLRSRPKRSLPGWGSSKEGTGSGSLPEKGNGLLWNLKAPG